MSPAQTTIRAPVLLLVGLCAIAAIFDLDVILGAFAAGFVLRHALPEGDAEFEEKLDGLAYGFFVPIFFVTSGMGIEAGLDAGDLVNLLAFFVLLVLVRGVPVWATLIGLIEDGQCVVGLVSAPALGRRWWAVSGGGAWTGRSLSSARRLSVSGVDDLSRAPMSYSSLSGGGQGVQQDQVNGADAAGAPGGLEDLDGALAVLGLDHLEAAAPQAEGERVAEVLLVLDQQDPRRAAHRRHRRRGQCAGGRRRPRARRHGALRRAHDPLPGTCSAATSAGSS